jgi:hypothetical protein
MPPRHGLIAVVPAGQDAPVSQLTRRLIEAMSAHGPVRHLDSRNIGDRPGGEVLEHIRSQIADGGHVVCEFDNRASAWSGPCLETADCILFVASADGECSLNEIEQEIGRRETAARRELILLHRNGKRSPYSGTLDWLRNRRVDLHHHAALESREDIERVARMSGGGARGFAHIGVIRALREQGIPIDLVGGTSMGACIGAQYVLGWDYQTMLDRNREGWIRLRPLRDYTIPMVSLLTGRKLVRTLQAVRSCSPTPGSTRPPSGISPS